MFSLHQISVTVCRSIAVVAVIGLTIGSPRAEAQCCPHPYMGAARKQMCRPWHPPVHPHAITAPSAYLHGQADLIRSKGLYLLLGSRAMVYQQMAQEQALENSKRAVAVYFERKQINAAARQQKHKRRHVQCVARKVRRPVKVRLTAVEYDRATGRLYWPAALQSKNYKNPRIQIESICRQVATSRADPLKPHGNEVRRLVDRMQRQLIKKIHEMPSTEFIATRRFLKALANEFTETKPLSLQNQIAINK